MGGHGPLGKPDDERVRRNAPIYDKVQIRWDGQSRGPELPLGLPGIKWSTRTIAWWETWRNSPQAMVMLDTDWELMLETALLHNQFWSPRRESVTGKDGKIKKQIVPRSPAELRSLAAEIRQRLEAMGGSYADRQRRGMKILTDNDEALEDEQIKLDAQDAVNYAEKLARYAAEKES